MDVKETCILENSWANYFRRYIRIGKSFTQFTHPLKFYFYKQAEIIS